MISNLFQVTADIAGAIKTAWDAGGATNGLALGYEGIEFAAPTDGAAWGRVTVQHVDAREVALSGGNGSTLYEAAGVVITELYAPTKGAVAAKGAQKTNAMADVVIAALRGQRTANGISFRNVRAVNVPTQPPFARLNVVADYVYHQVHQ